MTEGMGTPSARSGEPRRRRPYSGWLARLAIFSLFLSLVGWIATKFDWTAVGAHIVSLPLPSLLAMLAAWLVSLFLRPVRLWVLFRSAVPEANASYWPAFRADNIAMAVNSLVPARAGELAMVFVLRQSLGITAARSGLLVLLDRFLDFCTVVLIFVLSFLLSPGGAVWIRQTTIWLFVVTLAFVVGLLLLVRLRDLWLTLSLRAVARFAPANVSKWHGRLQELFSALGVLDDLRVTVTLMALSIATWAAVSLSYWFGIQALWPGVTPVAAAFTAAAVALSFLLPVAPAGIGLFQGAAVVALQLFGVGASAALALGIVAHVLQVGAILILAPFSMAWQGMSLRTLVGLRPKQGGPSGELT